MNDDIIVFGNNKKYCLKIIEKLCETGIKAAMPVLAGRNLDSDILRVVEVLKEKKIILVFKNEELKKISGIFHNKGIMEVYVYPWDTHSFDDENKNTNISEYLLPIDNRKPRLDYVEIEVSESCNLNCKGCSEFSNLAEGKKFTDFNVFRKDLVKLKEYFWGIGKIRLLGGEPLTNPDFIKFVATARELFPDSDIRLVSNGLLIPSLDKMQLTEIKNYNCSFDISNYPPTKKKINEIKSCLDAVGIAYNIGIPVKMFFKTILSEPLESPTKSFNNCIFSYCHSLGNGYLSACTCQLYIYRLNKAFNLTYPADDKIDIYHTGLNGWEINELFKNPHEFCRYCSKGMVPFKWEICPGSKAKADDWLIKPTVFNAKVIPIIQKIIKSFANRVRYFLQRPKRNR